MSCMTDVERTIYENCRNVAHGHGRQTRFDFLTDKPKTLASWLEANVRCEHCQIYKYCKKNIKADEDCEDVWEKWLKQESK